jgi:hypothetical protein
MEGTKEMKTLIRGVFFQWVGLSPNGNGFFSSGHRFNGGGYLYGASPYRYWRIGPIMIKKYM